MYQWQKNGADLPGENQITLQDIDATDGGEYTCVVSNAAGNDSTTVTLYIRPYIVVNPQPQLLTAVLSNVTFTCEALGFPAPSYQWRKDGDPGFSAVTQHLSLNPVNFGNEGYYTCVAISTIYRMNYSVESEQAVLISKSLFSSSCIIKCV